MFIYQIWFHCIVNSCQNYLRVHINIGFGNQFLWQKGFKQEAFNGMYMGMVFKWIPWIKPSRPTHRLSSMICVHGSWVRECDQVCFIRYLFARTTISSLHAGNRNYVYPHLYTIQFLWILFQLVLVYFLRFA